MTHAAITGWGKCMPPAVLDNAGLASFIDTTDEWITTRTGIKERRVSHVPMTTLSHVASMRALACAGLDPKDIDLIVLGTCSADEQVPNTASAIQLLHRRDERRGDGHQHRVHELPLWPVDRDGDDSHRRRAQRAGDRRRRHHAVHGLDAIATSRCCSATARPPSSCRRATEPMA